MEVLTFAGLPTVLFLDIPTAEQLAGFAGYRGIGIAGIARSQSPDWMTAHLPPLFETLAGLNAPISHYKVCSTFDSAPQVGSIGQAIDLAAPILRWRVAPARRGGPRRSGATKPSATCSQSRLGLVTGSTAIRPCPATRSRPWTRRMSAVISRSRPIKASV